MKIVRINPVDRLPNLAVNLPRYWCPHCGEYSVFSFDVDASLPQEVLKQFDELTPRDPPTGYDLAKSDFLCRVCARPVRVVYLWMEFRMGAYYRFAESVLETEA